MEIENLPVNLSTVTTSMTSTDSLLSFSNSNDFVIQSQNGSGADSLLDSSLQLGAAFERRDPILQLGAAYERRDSVDSTDQAPGWANEISREIKQKLLDLELKQYKYVVNVTIMENKAAGARLANSNKIHNDLLVVVELFRWCE
ncbi:13608_t:CDS:2 [Dentiscutata heterogama]|uniref:13608_t:CDS:1 n=1 Tax=Dentiscutata heterogama TaxID=1316150 RepID=A0ACA9LXC9_9GLOM|nr:13608_t:CDS:2 [Dentiscutata heterogama]